ncbi:MAG: OB-fold domain-containing protein [Desulfobacteraceae bacterium]|nr:OB-fold domain-containing protein [Desulfobacteraceae bacterium]
MDSNADNMILPFAKDIFTQPPYQNNSPDLLGGFCSGCNDYYFPKPGYCPKCLGNIQTRPIGSKGTIYSFTVVRTPPLFDLPSPYGIGYIDLMGTGLRVFGLFDPQVLDQLKIGASVVLSVKTLGKDRQGSPRLRPCFTLEPNNECQKI